METFPKCLKSILNDAAYDSFSSLAGLDANKMKELEEFVTANKELVNKLKCCNSTYYKGLNDFKFLPGHKTVILSLPGDIKELEAKKSNSKKTKKKFSSDEDAKMMLIKNLRAVSAKSGITLPQNVLTEVNLIDFERGSEESNFIYKCRFSCPFCNKTFGVIYKKFWMSSNATKHLKTHLLSQGHSIST